MNSLTGKHRRLRLFSVGIPLLLLLIIFFCGAPATAQTARAKAAAPAAPEGPVFRQAVNFAETIPLRDMEEDKEAYDKSRSMRYRAQEVEVGEKNKDPIRSINLNKVPDRDAALSLQDHDLPMVLPPPSLVFDGVSNSDNFALFGFRISPPDTVGDVGPNHYVQVVNLALRVFHKDGAAAGPPVRFSTIFAPLGTPASLRDDGDPIVLYDPMADRWLLSQFAFPSGTSTPPYHQLIAISKTPDPTGPYYIYDFIVSEGNNQFNDYPHFGVWPDGYYMADNQFLNGGAFDGAGVFAFDRVKMLAGDPNAGFIYFNRNLASFPEGQGGMLPADMDGVRPPPSGTPCPFAYFVADEFGAPRDGIRIFDFRADFNTPANSTFTERPESAAFPLGGIAVAAFNPLSPNGRDDVPQPPPASNTTARLDALSDRLMHRLQYTNFGTHESLVTTHTVNAGPDQTLANYRAAVRYYQLRKNPGNSPYAAHDQGTHAPADTTHRWMGSAAMNASGDLAVGFSASSLSVFPSIRYAARLGNDPLGSLAQGEQEIFTGSGVQTNTNSRWGDYSNISVDPVDDNTFWYTQQTYTSASQATSSVGWITKIAKFNVGGANTPFPKGDIAGTITSCANDQPVADAIVRTNTGFFTTTDANGTYTLPKMAPDTVTVTASKFTSAATATGVVVSNGSTTPVSLCVVPVSMVTQANSTIVHAGPNGMLDPGERVTVALNVQNTGGPGACTTALVGTLQASGGVTNPGSVNYGAVCGGGPVAVGHYTFTVDPDLPCGTSVTALIVLTDGATNYGTFTYTFATGTPIITLTQSFDTVTAPALPPNWITATAGAGTPWRTVTSFPDSAPNAVFAAETAATGLTELLSPLFPVSSTSAQVTFRNQFNTEAGFDGMVLEISTGGSAFADILAAGGTFVSGGYNTTLSPDFDNPLPNRHAWSGLSGGTAAAPAYITTTVNLPPAAAGQNVQLKWRFGSDASVMPATNPGVRLDSLSLIDGYLCAPVPVSAASRRFHAGIPYDINLPTIGPVGVEPRNPSATQDYEIVVSFNSPVSVTGTPQASVTSGVGAIGTGGASNGGAVSVSGSTISVPLTNVANAQRLTVTLSGVNTGGRAGDVAIPLGILIGDVNGNGTVTASDVGSVKANAGSTTSLNFRADVVPGAAINSTDISLVKSRSGTFIP